ncbi:MAG: hypothetical protein KDD22_08980, partial [Bdellovibrionales bacterium]|nr:hypothetical protein [Bdellovibrionales bacterium]
MTNIIIVEEDNRIRHQMEQFIGELNDENRCRTFKSLEEFEKLYFKPKTETETVPEDKEESETAAPSDGDEENELRLLSTIDLFIVKLSFLPRDPLSWVHEFYSKLK